jgi:tRNA(Ile)-lysidine synthase
MTLEEAARLVRYDALARVAGRLRASHIAVGHTADDQVETVLLWLLRGTASDGLAGMPAVRTLGRVRIIRPLIDLWRAEVLGYLASERVPFRVDPTNRLRGPLRNRIRRDLLPHLEGYNPGIKALLRRLADQVADDAAWLGRQAQEAYARVVRRGGGGITVDVAGFRGLPASLQRRVARMAFAAAGGNIRALGFVHIERLREMASRDRPGEQADLPGLRARRRDAKILLVRAAQRPLRRRAE